MKKEFEKPAMEVQEFEVEDVITTSTNTKPTKPEYEGDLDLT